MKDFPLYLCWFTIVILIIAVLKGTVNEDRLKQDVWVHKKMSEMHSKQNTRFGERLNFLYDSLGLK